MCNFLLIKVYVKSREYSTCCDAENDCETGLTTQHCIAINLHIVQHELKE